MWNFYRGGVRPRQSAAAARAARAARAGRSTRSARSVDCRVWPRWGLSALLLLGSSGVASEPAALRESAATPTRTLSLAEAESLALESEPGQLAWLARAAAFESRSVAAGELPDPSLRLGLANLPIDSGSFSAEPMTQAQIGLRQAFPPGRSRSLSTREMHYQALEMTESAEARARDVRSSVPYRSRRRTGSPGPAPVPGIRPATPRVRATAPQDRAAAGRACRADV